MRKRIFYAALGVAALAGLTLLLRNQRIVKNEAYFEAVSKYVYAFTSGDIGRNDAIRVRFIDAAVGKDFVGKPVDPGILNISPAIEGDVIWEDDRTIKVQPKEALPSGKRFVGRVRLNKLFEGVPAIARIFEFNFSIRALAFNLETDGLQADRHDPHLQQITGRVHINEAVDPNQVEKILKAKQGAKALLVNWTHAENGQEHSFSIVGVERSNLRSKVNIAWDGAAIGVNRSGKTEQVVPAVDEFFVLSARVVQVNEQYVLINFSDPIAPGQDLNGLIRIEGFEGKQRFVVDGNFVRMYPDQRLSGEKTLAIEAGIRNTAGMAMQARSTWTLNFEDFKPSVRLVGRGAIIPQNGNGSVIFPFEAVGLNAVDVEVFKIFNSNILQFLQVNEIEGENELGRVGKIILQKKISLRELDPGADTRNWQRYAFDLKDMIKQDPGAIYQVRIAFRKGYTNLNCGADGRVDESNGRPAESDGDDMSHIGRRDEDGNPISIMGSYRGIYWGEDEPWWYDEDGEGGYSWERREQPCAKEYYFSERFARRNVFVSDLGLTGKRGKDGSLFVAVTDLHTAQPVAGIDLEIFNYQLQSIGKTRSANDGTALFENLREAPFVAVAGSGNRRGYLRMVDGNTLSLSRFDVAGVEAQKGLKGYIYGERGVWRPGDSLFLNFVLEDKIGNLPAGHPVTFELSDPRGAVQHRMVQNVSVGGVYPLHCQTRPDAITGDWSAKVSVGGASFNKTIKIETVKPNRLKMDLDFGRKEFTPDMPSTTTGALTVNWLHGAVARNLKTNVEMQIRKTKTEFKNLRDFVFDDPARNFYSEPQVLFDAPVDQNGKASVPLQVGDLNEAPGKLIANFRVRCFENSGDFSTDNFAIEVFPFTHFAGVSIPSGQWGQKSIPDRGGIVRFTSVDKNGRPQAGRKMKAMLFRTDWRWWWDEDAFSDVAQFNSTENISALDAVELTTDAAGMASWKVRPEGWGRFFVRVVDVESGHAAGDFFWRGYPNDRDDIKSRNAAAMLMFSTDKEKYNVGEDVTLKVPAGEAGRILLTLENGTRVMEHRWFEAKAGDNLVTFKTTEAMAPTVYAHVSLMQPHAQTKNDLPIRMYGVIPILVENAGTKLNPQIDMPDVLKPDENFTVAVRETGGKACTYTLAVVDEGLLDLTRFKTPNPWEAFFAREALGVRTWDIYDYVLGAYGAELERILAIGGDGINQKSKNAAQANRFKPVVKHLGPFKLERGQMAKHNLKIENYVGSVRVMVVCSAPAPGSKGAYGSAEKTCPVRKPLMVMPTLPRVLGIGENLRLPIDVFALEAKVKSATVNVRETSGLVNISGDGSNTLSFAEPGDQMTYFNLKVGNKSGVARFVVSAQGGGETVSQEIEIQVRNPNPNTSAATEGVLEPGQEWSFTIDPGKYSELTGASFEVSALPPINLSRHLQYLIQYPHGCVEQTTSTAFPQLYVDIISPLSDKQRAKVTKNIAAAVNRLQQFQDYTGGFAYWPGGSYVNPWSSTYAGHFLLEAKVKGYAVPEAMIERWITHQTKLSKEWNAGSSNYYDSDLTQAYRLYSLAVAGKPELASMNRMREKKNMYREAAYLLATAYALSGKPEVAKTLLTTNWLENWQYEWWGYTYGSSLRDRALMLESFVAGGDNARAQNMVNLICQNLSGGSDWSWNTQSLATALRAIGKYLQKNTAGGPVYTWKSGGEAYQKGDNSKPVSTVDLDVLNGIVTIKNTGNVRLYTRSIVSGHRIPGTEVAANNNLQLSVRYTDLKGNPIDVSKLNRGVDFVAEVTVSRNKNNTMRFNFNELALTQVFAGGWEILNTRMTSVTGVRSDPMDYQDVRDDRVLTYFNLPYQYNNDPYKRTYRIQLNAAYTGKYYLPGAECEAMYDNRIQANLKGQWVEVL